MKKRLLTALSLTLVLVLSLMAFTGCANDSAPNSSQDSGDTAPADGDSAPDAGAGAQRTYYYVAPGLGQPFTYDMILGFKYAAQQFGCEIISQGPDDWNFLGGSEALEQVLAKNPDGIVTAAWDASMNPGIQQAQEMGIPIVVVEAHSGAEGDVYIGLDNVDAGRETAETLIDLAGNSGKVLVIGNWGSTNIDEKYIGLQEVLADSGWEILGDQDSDAEAQVALQAAKDLLNTHPDATAFVGLDSACGAAIATAMMELGMEPDSLTVVCADREDAMLDYIREGYIDASLTNRTAMMCYLAVQFLESVNNYGFNQIPVTGDNAAADISVFPRNIFTGNVVITKDNVDNFDHDSIDSYDTPLWS